MARNGHGRRCNPRGRTFVSCLRDFLTPEVWKQAHKAAGKSCSRSRAWTVQPLVLVLLSMTWCLGDSQAERFEVARGFCVTLLPKRRRPGKTVKGFQQALARMPMAVFDALKTALRRRLLQVLEPALRADGFIPLGCDGTRLLCPRVNALENCMGQSARADTPPQMWVTAIVHLTTGLLWSWRAGPGDSSERKHLAALLSTLPALALVVTDAGYPSFELAKAMTAQNVCFLMRVSSNMTFYLDHELDAPVEAWQEGEVYWWPHELRETKQRPLKVRLLQVKGRKHPVWLITNVFEAERLSLATASRFYKLRWENEGFFRSFKRTLGKVKLTCRTEALVYREAEGSLLATQLLQAQGVHALAACEHKQAKNSLRQLILLVRDEMYGRSHGKAYGSRLRATMRENRVRTSVKEKRIWPGRKPHKALPAPNLRMLAPHEKALLNKRLSAA